MKQVDNNLLLFLSPGFTGKLQLLVKMISYCYLSANKKPPSVRKNLNTTFKYRQINGHPYRPFPGE